MADAKSAGVVSFAFSKKTDRVQLASSKLGDDSTKADNEETDYVKSLEGKQINSTVKREEKKDLVIPMIARNQWRVPDSGATEMVRPDEKEAATVPLNLDEIAVREVLKDALRAQGEMVDDGAPTVTEVPLLMQNRLPVDAEGKLDTFLPVSSSLDDYEAVPVEEYGMAMLRGMGWKANEGIGAKNKRVTPTVNVTVRPKGLGLGADRSVLDNAAKLLAANTVGDSGEDLVVRNSAFVRVIIGKRVGSYGQVESMDENTGRACVRMAVGGDVVSVPELCLKAVSSVEYKESARVLNKGKYDEYKSKQEKQREADEEAAAAAAEEERHRRKKKKRSSRSHSRSRSRSRDREHRARKDRGGEGKKKSDSRSHKKEESHHDPRQSWLFPLLRVRCVDSEFKSGKYYKHKMDVIDVISHRLCICRADDGALLDSVPVSALETVIPREEPAYVMVVAGRNKGQVCEVIERDRHRSRATVQTLPDREVYQVSYDDVCQYVGPV